MNDSGKTTVTDMTRLGLLLLTAAVLLADPVFTRGDEAMLIVEKPPADGLVVARVDLTAAVQRCAETAEPAGLRAMPDPAGGTCPSNWSPTPTMTSSGMLPALWFCAFRPIAAAGYGSASRPARPRRTAWDGRVEMPGVRLTQDAQRQGGFPTQITFADGKVFDSLRWNDRLFDRRLGWFSPAADLQAKVGPGFAGAALHGRPRCRALRSGRRQVAPLGAAGCLRLALSGRPAAGAGAGRDAAEGARRRGPRCISWNWTIPARRSPAGLAASRWSRALSPRRRRASACRNGARSSTGRGPSP